MAVQIVGLDRLMKKLSALGGNVPKALEKAVKRTTLSAQGDAIRLVPVDTGNLLHGIRTRWEPHGDGGFTGIVYDNVEYAIYQEMGTERMDAQPYMMPALNANRDVFEREAESALLQEIAKRGG